MKIKLIILLCPAIFYAQSLSSVIDSAMNNNNMIKSKIITEKSKYEDMESAKRAYYPTVDLGASLRSANQKTSSVAGDIYSAYANIGFDLYDGGVKSNAVKKSESTFASSKYDTNLYKNDLYLSIIEDFYSMKTIQAQLRALKDKDTQLKEELDRANKFYDVGISTKDDVDNLAAAYSNNVYQIDSSKYELLSLKRLFTIKTGIEINSLDDSYIIEPKYVSKNINNTIKQLDENSKVLKYSAKSLDATYKPKLRLENTYTFYDYDRSDASHFEGLDKQNILMLTLSMRLFDNGTVKRQKTSLLLQRKALEEEIKQAKLSQDINIDLAKSKIITVKAQINSAKKSLKSATSAFKTISKKYEVGKENHVTYLDALSVKTDAKAQYEAALNNLQVAYAGYYYHANKNIREFIK